ncbi:hypothetical protein [Xanthomonas arboricola]|uniref:hypothetical protein n=1 Tax=Xanthomonas arboricola TaxID=56448 RepID=UPI000E0FB833|nr:hypothetical protein [Xanthomonas arboricola]
MPAQSTPLPTPTSPAEWKRLEAAATAELARRTAQAHQQILGLLSAYGHLLSDAQRRRLHQRLQRGGR